jgi:GntR family transcriptional regulator
MQSLGKIDFNSRIPYYIQLIGTLKEKIESKSWNAGDKIPSEEELCVTYQISRTVVRQALQELEREGLIVRRKGYGTFIAKPKIVEGLVEKLTGFYDDMVNKGLIPQTRVLSQTVIPAEEKVAHFLEIPVGTKVVEIFRLRSVNDEPIQIVTSYIPFEICPKCAEVDLTNLSLYEFLEKECHLFISRGRRFIEAVSANAKEAQLLQIDRGSPLIMLDSISYMENGLPLEYFHALHRGDRSRFVVELVRYSEAKRSHQDIILHSNNLLGENELLPQKED